MKIASVNVDGFGVWSDLSLGRLSSDLHVFYGPNEAGKTTLMQFVRSVLYGFSPERRRYLPPVHGGRPGGSVELTSPNGRFHVLRHDDVRDANGAAKTILEAADGTRQGEHLLKVLLCNIDEAIFRNVFAVGLREMQELGALGDTEAAEMLYNLSAGLDRVSLIDVIRELEHSRNALFDRESGEGRIARLLERRKKLTAEIEDLCAATARYARLASTRNQMDREIARLEEEKNEVQYRSKTIELAVQLRDKWVERAGLNERLAAFDAPPPPPEGAVEQLAEIEAKLAGHRRRVEEIGAERRGLKESVAALAVNETLWRQAARIEALREQESWIASLQSSTAALYSEIGRIESELAAEREQLGLGNATERDTMGVFSKPAIRSLRSPSRRLSETRRQLVDAKERASAAEETAKTLEAQIAAGLSDRQETSATAAVEEAGDLVSRLRRRVEMDERLDRMTKSRTDLERQTRESLETQLLPAWVLIGLGGIFVFGLLLAGFGLIFGWEPPISASAWRCSAWSERLLRSVSSSSWIVPSRGMPTIAASNLGCSSRRCSRPARKPTPSRHNFPPAPAISRFDWKRRNANWPGSKRSCPSKDAFAPPGKSTNRSSAKWPGWARKWPTPDVAGNGLWKTHACRPISRRSR